MSFCTTYRACPCCKGEKVVESNCLLTLEPTLSLEWYPSKNSNLSTQQVTPHLLDTLWYMGSFPLLTLADNSI